MSFTSLQEKLALGGLEGTFAQVLAEQERRMPSARALTFSLKKRPGKRSAASDWHYFKLNETSARNQSSKHRSPIFLQTASMSWFQLRFDLLEKLAKTRRNIIRDITRLDTEERAYRRKITEVSEFLVREDVLRKKFRSAGSVFLRKHSKGDCLAVSIRSLAGTRTSFSGYVFGVPPS